MSEAKRQLKIKTGSVKRLSKEVVMYKQDEETETDRVARMKAAGSDASDIKHAVRPDMRLQCQKPTEQTSPQTRRSASICSRMLAAGASTGRGSYDGA